MLQDRRNKFFVLFVSMISILLVVGVAMAYVLPANNFPFELEFIKRIGHLCLNHSLLLIFLYFVYWYFYHKAYKGFEYAFTHARMMSKLRRMLLEASTKHTTQEYAGEEKVARLPKIKIFFEDDLKSGKVIISNSIRFHKLFEEMDISSALGKYVVLEHYLSDDFNYYIYEFETAGVKQKQFNSFKEYHNYCQKQEKDMLHIDDKNSVPLHHSLIVGATGSGKTIATEILLLQLTNFSVRPHIYIADIKYSSLYVLGKKIACDRTVATFNEAVQLLERFNNQMEKRAKTMSSDLEKNMNADYRAYDYPAYVFVFEEFASFQDILKTKDSNTKKKVEMLLSNIVLKGRQLGFFMWFIMQKSDSKLLPTYLRDNLVFKVVLGQATDTTYQTAFEEYADLPKLKFQQGQGLYTYQGQTRHPKVCAFPYLTFEMNAYLRWLNEEEHSAGVM